MPAIAIPTKVESARTTFTPAFRFVAQTNDSDDVFACAAMPVGKTIEEVRETAIAKTKHPVRDPYYLGETRIAALLAQLGLVATVYREIGRVADIPDVALILVDYSPDMEVGISFFIVPRLAMHLARRSSTRSIRRRGAKPQTAFALTSRTSLVIGRSASTS
ncbi:hypothetical protein M0D69_01060 [Caballeronia sp. SEWSISQ10-4 2]|uniref:hypothetical protein n=1 Tax=Caballeronia sp. SEWSISQ10-4 2 TaxID=2937438 RepID=UPI0026523436|nr:hypothetical protein [Caballeronia sp. SEWSISQ10-4 2]MDN7176633.1 hypothetical protein [Caballeronia sp. SEWSISQ10-4 2]